jgi:glutamate-1-semialdehyde aminotransferase
MSLNVQRLIDAKFTDEDMHIIFYSFETTMSAMYEVIEEMKDKLPFSDEMVKRANHISEDILNRIKNYKSSAEQNIDQMFKIWAQMFEQGE